MHGRGEDVRQAWLEYSLMRDGHRPWEMPPRYIRLYSLCQQATEVIERKERFRQSRMT